jgi:hypothetical protein
LSNNIFIYLFRPKLPVKEDDLLEILLVKRRSKRLQMKTMMTRKKKNEDQNLEHLPQQNHVEE